MKRVFAANAARAFRGATGVAPGAYRGGLPADTTLVFGIGATRAGTSWLYRYLAQHPDCALPPIKELHFFDRAAGGAAFALDGLRRVESRAAQALARAKTGAEALAARRRLDAARALARILDAETLDLDAYLSFLADQLRDGAHLVADITPAYGLLPAETLGRMAGLCEDVRFVYVLREPVARLWSNMRLMAARRARVSGVDRAQALSRISRRWLDGKEPELDARANYAATLENLGRAVPEDQRLVLFHEDLFDPERGPATVEALAVFLGIRPMAAPLCDVVHDAPPAELPPALRAEMRARLAPQYEAVARYAGGRLPAAWIAAQNDVTES